MENKIKAGVVEELHRPARKRFPRRKFEVKSFMEYMQADLADLSNISRMNGGNHFILVVIDCFSKRVWATPLKNKSALVTTQGFERLSSDFPTMPKLLQVDDGKEFWNSTFAALMKRLGIHYYSTFSSIKAGIAERFIRTLKERLWKHFSLTGKYNYTKDLQKIIDVYNNTRHGTTGISPMQVNEKNENSIRQCVYRRVKRTVRGKLRSGDFVRISKYKTIFEKGYTPKWSTELFVIAEKKNTLPPTYILADLQGEKIEGSFYEHELQKTKYRDHYLVERVLKTQGRRQFVKWLGFGNEFNSWINT